MKLQKHHLPDRFERFAKNRFHVEAADTGIEALKQWHQKIGTPVTLAEGKDSRERDSNADGKIIGGSKNAEC